MLATAAGITQLRLSAVLTLAGTITSPNLQQVLLFGLMRIPIFASEHLAHNPTLAIPCISTKVPPLSGARSGTKLCKIGAKGKASET